MSRKKGRNKNVCGTRFGKEMYWQTADYNSRLFWTFRAQIMALALNRYKWINLPPTCDERYLEMILLTQGQASIAHPRKQPGIFYSNQCAQIGIPNVYDNPTQWYAIGNNGWRFKANHKNGVIVWDNRVRYPLMEKIDIWARELVDVIRTKQINRMHQKIPFVFAVPQEMEQQAANVFKQAAGGEPAIIGSQAMNLMKPELLWENKVPFIGEELTAEEMNIWNEIYRVLGIANQTVKMERMIESEVRSQQEPNDLLGLDGLNCRRDACRKLNARFPQYFADKPLNVVWRQDNTSENYNYIHNIKDRMEGAE